MSFHIAAIAGIWLVAACGSSSDATDENPGGLVHANAARVEPIDVARAAADPAELRRALIQPHHRIATELGAHAFRGSSKLRVTLDGDVVEQIDDETVIDRAANGDYRARLDNSRDYGRHVVYADGVLYLRPRYGKYHRRAPTSEQEPGRIADQIYATLGDYFDLVSHATDPKDEGAVTHAGRPARRIALQPAPKPRSRTETAARKKWREQIAVERVAGEVILDDATGAVLDGSLEAEIAFTRDGNSYTMALEVNHAITEIGTDPEIAAPPDDQTVATRLRSHEAEERDTLLEGIAPPARRAPAP